MSWKTLTFHGANSTVRELMSKTIARNSFVLYQDNHDIFASLSQEKKGDLIDAIFAYQKTSELPNDPLIKVAISSFVSQFKRDSQKWEKTCEEKTIAGKMGNLKRWHPQLYKKVINGEITLEQAMQGLQTEEVSQPDRTQSDPIGNVANIAVNVSDNVSVSVNDIINDIKPTKKPKGFIAPSLQEVQDYCKSRNSSVNAIKFFDYYTAGDWKDKDGKQVKNWKQRLLSWEGRNNSVEENNSVDPFISKLNTLAGKPLFSKVVISYDDVVLKCETSGLCAEARNLTQQVRDDIKQEVLAIYPDKNLKVSY